MIMDRADGDDQDQQEGALETKCVHAGTLADEEAPDNRPRPAMHSFVFVAPRT